MSDDLISRRLAIEALYDWEMTYDWDEHCREEPKSPCIVSPIDVIDELPSAQPSDDYNRGWEDGQNALREEQWENGRDRLD